MISYRKIFVGRLKACIRIRVLAQLYILIVRDKPDTPYISQNTCDHKDKRSIS